MWTKYNDSPSFNFSLCYGGRCSHTHTYKHTRMEIQIISGTPENFLGLFRRAFWRAFSVLTFTCKYIDTDVWLCAHFHYNIQYIYRPPEEAQMIKLIKFYRVWMFSAGTSIQPVIVRSFLMRGSHETFKAMVYFQFTVLAMPWVTVE